VYGVIEPHGMRYKPAGERAGLAHGYPEPAICYHETKCVLVCT